MGIKLGPGGIRTGRGTDEDGQVETVVRLLQQPLRHGRQAAARCRNGNVDAKYDAEIEAAQGNADQVEKLEKQKANEKLKIQKKYADVNSPYRLRKLLSTRLCR